MVHNGIEYGDMQLISEAYSLLKNRKGLDDDEMAVVFEEWNKGELDSFLIEITKNILRFLRRRRQTVAGQNPGCRRTERNRQMERHRSNGRKRSVDTDYGSCLCRMLSALSSEREKASGLYPEPVELGENLYVEEIRQALYAAKLISYAQGFSLIRRASERYGWNLDFGTIAQIWRKGCIIRSVFLQKITDAYRKNPELQNLLFDDFFRTKIQVALPSWRKVVAEGALSGVALAGHEFGPELFRRLAHAQFGCQPDSGTA